MLYILSAFAVVNSLVLNESYLKFIDFSSKYNKNYINEQEREHRYNVFSDNLNIINKHNSENHSWKMGINQFTDLTPTEFKSTTSCYDSDKLKDMPRMIQNFQVPIEIPSEVDWTTFGAVTPVKDQAQCGSCWSFSTTGSVEGAYFLATGKLASFSEQQLVDCSTKYGNQGCNGGLMDNSFNYIKDSGICLESDYPYISVDGTCKKCTIVTKIDSFVDVTPNSETALQQAVSLQPVSVAIEADQFAFQFYSSGVLTASCGTSLDHGVLVVGYGSLNGVDYWKVKNSWGASWGDKGYILLARNVKQVGGQCGIAAMASYPKIKPVYIKY